MARPKGQPKLGGRKKGTLNKKSIAVKEALLEAFEQNGGVPSLVAWAKDNPTEFFRLWAKLLPTQITGKDGGPIEAKVTGDVFKRMEQLTAQYVAAATVEGHHSGNGSRK